MPNPSPEGTAPGPAPQPNSSPSGIRITVGSLQFEARLEEAMAPLTCAAFLRLLPFEGKLIQARWSGEAAWVPLGALSLGIPEEHATSEPAPGQLLLYPSGISETEILFPYGQTRFASKFGELRGNHFLTVPTGTELEELGRLVLWQGAQTIRIEARRPSW